MTQQTKLDQAQAPGRTVSRQRTRGLPLVGAVGFTLVAVLILVYELAIAVNTPSGASAIAISGSGAAPASLDSQAISFPDQPQAVPEIKFVDGDGRPLSLADFHGQAILLNIWATWCAPCRKEMPSLDRLQAKFDPTKFRVLAVSIDRKGIPAVRKFYAELGLKSLGAYVDQSAAAQHRLGLIGIPGTLLINVDGQEIGRKIGPADWESPNMVTVLQEHLGLKTGRTEGTSP